MTISLRITSPGVPFHKPEASSRVRKCLTCTSFIRFDFLMNLTEKGERNLAWVRAVQETNLGPIIGIVDAALVLVV
jgi:hypothetical protein